MNITKLTLALLIFCSIAYSYKGQQFSGEWLNDGTEITVSKEGVVTLKHAPKWKYKNDTGKVVDDSTISIMLAYGEEPFTGTISKDNNKINWTPAHTIRNTGFDNNWFRSSNLVINKNHQNIKFYNQIIKLMSSWDILKKKTDLSPKAIESWLPEAGVRPLYAIMKNNITLKTLETLVGEKAFLKGPHGEHFNLKSKKSFGHYNPKFVSKLKSLVIEFDKYKLFKTTTIKFYDELAMQARVYQHVYDEVLNSDTLTKTKLIKSYSNAIKKGDRDSAEELEKATSELFEDEFIEQKYYNAHEAAAALEFWIRRSIDGTDDEFIDLLETVIYFYDYYHYEWEAMGD